MTEGPSDTGEWVVFCAALTGAGIVGLLSVVMLGLAIAYLYKLLVDIWRYGL